MSRKMKVSHKRTQSKVWAKSFHFSSASSFFIFLKAVVVYCNRLWNSVHIKEKYYIGISSWASVSPDEVSSYHWKSHRE